MKCLMFGLACGKERFDRYVREHNSPFSVAHYIFEKSFIDELEETYPVYHNYIYQSGNTSLKAAKVRSEEENITEKTKTRTLGFLNLPLIKFVSLFFSTCRRIKQFHKENGDGFFILSSINYFPVALAARRMSRKYGVKNVIIFTDCSVGYGYDQTSGNKLKDLARKKYKSIIHSMEKDYDAYVLFSEPMNELVNPMNKPFCVMEGFFDPSGLDLTPCAKNEKFVVLYGGSILESFSIQNIVRAVKQINDERVELWIAGDGPYLDELKKLAGDDKRIKFLGFVSRNTLFEYEKQASLLINARNPMDAYTKYSFPSKTFEYLASGTPFASTKLGCYTDEYNGKLMLLENNQPETVAEAIRSALSMDRDELEAFGKESKEFVMTRKRPDVQTAKVIEFLNEILGKEE